MIAKSSLIGFGAGALLAGAITYFGLSRQAAPAVSEAAQRAPLVESSSTIVEPAEPAGPVAPRTYAAKKSQPAKPKMVVRQEPVAVPAPVPPAPEPPKAVEPVAKPAPAPVAVAVPEPGASAPRKAPPPPPPAAPAPNSVTLPAGTTLAVRLTDSLASDVVQQGKTFHATLDQPLVIGDFVIAERGARVDGRVVDVLEAGKVKGVASMSLELTHIRTSDGQRVPVTTATFEKEAEKSVKSDATKVAVGAGVGAALGAIFGGGKGAAIGTAAGGAAGAGTVLATKGKPVVLPAETRLTFALRAPVTITEKQ